MSNKKALVVGGGIFGVCAAIELSKSGLETHLFEKNNQLMKDATSVNQNRFHFGYHYPRSAATAKQCLEGIDSFKEYFGNSLVSLKENYYAIAKQGSRVSYGEYIRFCEGLGLPHKEEYPPSKLLNRSEISGCIRVDEQIINLEIMKKTAEKLLIKSGVKVFLNKEFQLKDKENFQIIVNATYSNLNNINKILNLPTRKFRYDICNVPVLKLPKVLNGVGITIMDGEFYSILPYGNSPYHLLWSVTGSASRSISKYPPRKKLTKIANYKDDSYVPLLKQAKLIEVLRVVKVLRPDVELSDERVTDLIDYGNGNYAILSAKINTCVLTARRLVRFIYENDKNKRK